jgi:hypothetical protein
MKHLVILRIKSLISLLNNYRFNSINFLIIVLFVINSLSSGLMAQVTGEIVVPARIINGDTMPLFSLPEVTVFSFRPFKTAKDEQNVKRLVNNVKKVYPYAKLAAAKLKYYDQLAQNASSDKERDRITKRAEEDLKTQFEADIESMTRTQGKLLIKLIDRETGKSSYEIIKLSRGGFRAIFWQSMSSVFGLNLKERYEKEGDDATIEMIINLIDKGAI